MAGIPGCCVELGLWGSLEGDFGRDGFSDFITGVLLSLDSVVACDSFLSVSSRRLAKFSSAARLRNSTNVICGFVATFGLTGDGGEDRGNWV